jgi:hypothetical protein
MAVYIIGYDLNRPGQDYSDLFDAIKSHANGWWHHLDSTWLIKSSSTAKAIRDDLWAHMDNNDELLVAVISAPAAWEGFDESGSKWLRDNL